MTNKGIYYRKNPIQKRNYPRNIIPPWGIQVINELNNDIKSTKTRTKYIIFKEGDDKWSV
jgi:hypothetical protein